MDDKLGNLIIEHLKDLRARLDKHDQRFDDIEKRFGGVERGLNSVRKDLASMMDLYLDQRDSLDNLRARIERLEEKAGLDDAFSTDTTH